MAPGINKVIVYDPPGAIGIIDEDRLILLPFDENDTTTRPQDEDGKLDDLDTIATGTPFTMPAVVNGVLGRARAFSPILGTGLAAKDKVPGATLSTRDVSIQAVMTWNPEQQNLGGDPGTIVCRGLGDAAAEYIAYAVEINPVFFSGAITGAVRMYWQNSAGGVESTSGAEFSTLSTNWIMLTVTRRWISTTLVRVRYYIGDLLLGEETSSAGDIAGGTDGTMTIGARNFSGVNERFLAGSIDQLAVFDRELCAEEIEATWLRITKYQPLGERMFLENHDPGFPISEDPDDDMRLETRMRGQSFGLAAAAIENLRANFLPQRAYGTTLEQWEEVVKVTPEPSDTLEERRARVLSRLQQRLGSSIPGLEQALSELIDGASPDDLEFLAFSTTIRDSFDTIEGERWSTTPAASWTSVSGAARTSPAAGSYVFSSSTRAWRTMRLSTGAGDAKQAHAIAKFAMTTPQQNLECGLFFENKPAGNYIMLGLRDDAGTFKIVSERFQSWVSQGVTTHASLPGNPANLWLHLYQTTTDGVWKAAWSTTSATTGYTISADIPHPATAHWAGIYTRSTAAIAGAAQVNVDDFLLRVPFSMRPFNAYVFLDAAALFVSPDSAGARSVVEAVKHGFIHGTFITSKSLILDDPTCGLDSNPMGAL